MLAVNMKDNEALLEAISIYFKISDYGALFNLIVLINLHRDERITKITRLILSITASAFLVLADQTMLMVVMSLIFSILASFCLSLSFLSMLVYYD